MHLITGFQILKGMQGSFGTLGVKATICGDSQRKKILPVHTCFSSMIKYIMVHIVRNRASFLNRQVGEIVKV